MRVADRLRTGEPCGSPHTVCQKSANDAARNSGMKKRRLSVRRCVRLRDGLLFPVAELAATFGIVYLGAGCVKYGFVVRRLGHLGKGFRGSWRTATEHLVVIVPANYQLHEVNLAPLRRADSSQSGCRSGLRAAYAQASRFVLLCANARAGVSYRLLEVKLTS